MRAFTVLTVGVCLVFGLQASEWASREQAARIAMQGHDYDSAAQLFGESVGLATTPMERATALASYGIALNRAGRNAEAKAALERALEAWTGTAAEGRAVAAAVLGSVDRSLGDYQDAERVFRDAMADTSASSGERATLMVNLADLLREQARETEAREVLNEAGRLTGLSQDQQTSVLVETAELTRDMHLWSESIAEWNRIGEIAGNERSSGLEAVFTGGLGETWFAAGNLVRAEPLLRRSLQLLRNEPGVSYCQVATALSLMARLYIDEDKLALAEEALDEALAKDEDSLGPGHPQVASLLELRADILSRRGEAQSAREDLERAQAIMSSHFGGESTAVAGVFAALGDVEQRDHRPAVAAVQYRMAMDLLRNRPDRMRFGSPLVVRYAAALKAAHKPAEAQALLRSFAGLDTSNTSVTTGAQSFRDK